MPEDLMIGDIKDRTIDVIILVIKVKVVSLQLWEKKFKDQMTLNLRLIEPMLSIWMGF